MRIGGHEQDRYGTRLLLTAQDAVGFKPINTWHSEIEQHEIRQDAGRCTRQLGATGHRRNVQVLVLCEYDMEQFAHRRIIFCQHYRVHPTLSPPNWCRQVRAAHSLRLASIRTTSKP